MKKTLMFEEAVQMLEDFVQRLENGNMTLDESLKVFEEAVKLVRICNEKLDQAQLKVKLLTKNSDGTVTDSDFPGMTDET